MVFIRVDANSEIASGHLMRMITVAKELEKRGEVVIFICADDNPKQTLLDNDLYMINLEGDWKDLSKESSKMLLILADEEEMPILLIDTYSVSMMYVNLLSMFSKVCYLGSKKENLGNLSLLINYSADIDQKFYEENYPNTRLLLGVEYSVLRPEFVGYERDFVKPSNHVLLTTGNTDNHSVVLSILDKIQPEYYTEDDFCWEDFDIHFDVVVGSMFKDREELFKRYSNCPWVTLHENPDMASLMKECNIAITAGGNTMNELAAMGVAIVALSISEDQVNECKCFAKNEACVYAGSVLSNYDSVINYAILNLRSLLRNDNLRIKIAKNAKEFVIGNGVEKVCDAIMELE
ncbi:MAG: DUF354 domain-containing protein [Lachnospiraceae bacterium]|nr:DUF354 domain-containing protein [Lachnospiraceae bacterium]